MERVNQIFAKDSFTGEDMDFLMANKHLLSQDHLVRLGLAPAPTLVVEVPVKESILETVLAPIKKRGRPKKVTIS
jgi:hypothetical protein